MGIERILHIREILDLILDFLPHDSGQLSFGLTCKAVWSAAAPAKWRSVTLNWAFQGLLPESHFRYDNQTGAILWSGAARTPKPIDTDWAPFLRYTDKVHDMKLDLLVFEYKIQSLHLLFFFTLHEPGVALFPRLESVSLELFQVGDGGVEWLVNFLDASMTPALKSVDLKYEFYENEDSTAHAFCSLLKALQTRTSLENLQLHFLRDVDEELPPEHRTLVQTEVIAVLNQLSRLRKVVVTVLDEDTFFAAVQIDHVEYLSLTFHGLESELPGRSLARLPPFSSLKSLVLERPLDIGFRRFIDSIRSPSLATLKRYMIHPEELRELQDCLERISRRWSQTFQHLSLQFEERWDRTVELEVVGMKPFLDPLIACHRLQSIRLEFYSEHMPLMIQDSDMDIWTRSWPNLRVFRIDDNAAVSYAHNPASQHPPPLTLTGLSLAFLASRCRNLEELEISVDFDACDIDALVQQTETACYALIQFHSMCSRARDACKVGCFIHAIFPNLPSSQLTTSSAKLYGSECWKNDEMLAVVEALRWRASSTTPLSPLVYDSPKDSYAEGLLLAEQGHVEHSIVGAASSSSGRSAPPVHFRIFKHSAVTRAMKIPELFFLIAAYLDRRELAALALTCHRIARLATHRLYNELDTYGFVNLASTVVQSWIDTDILHAPRVEVLVSSVQNLVITGSIFTMDEYEAVRDWAMGAQPLLPSLASLSFEAIKPRDLPYLQRFLSQRVSCLTLHCGDVHGYVPEEDGWIEPLRAVLNEIPNWAPHVMEYSMTMALGTKTPLVDDVANLIARMEVLRSWESDTVVLHPHCVEALHQVRLLTELKIGLKVPSGSWEYIDSATVPLLTLVGLRKVSAVLSHGVLITLLSMTNCLESLDAVFQHEIEAFTKEQTVILWEGLWDRVPRMREISLQYHFGSSNSGEAPSYWDLLLPRGRCGKLTRFNLGLYATLGPNLATYRHLTEWAEAWPNLTSFSLDWNIESTGELMHTPGIDLRAVEILSNSCPDLKDLMIANIETRDSGYFPVGATPRQSPLVLEIGKDQSEVDNALYVAKFLRMVWPGVIIKCRDECIPSVRDMWGTIRRLLRSMVVEEVKMKST